MIGDASMEVLAAARVDARSLPVVDLSRLGSSNAATRAAEARMLRRACIEVGFFYLTGHRVSEERLGVLFDASRRFFDLPLEDKMELDISGSAVMRGYTPLLSENTDAAGRGDLHEAFDVGGVLFDGAPGESFNRYPRQLPELKRALDDYRRDMLELSRSLLRGFALALDLPEEFFAPLVTEPQSFLRILHYPSQPGPIDPLQIGIGAHTDYECFTILAQDRNPALQIADGQGGWIGVDALPGAFVVNIGDQLARWTNDLFRSTLHRAINRTGNPRYSIPYFFGPNPDALIEVLPGCIRGDGPARYPGIRAGDYSRDRFEKSYARSAASGVS